MSAAANPEQWSGERVARWLRQAAGLERQLAPVSELLFAAARLRSGESVLDVGCGTGPTTRAAAEAVGSTGRVTGMDISGDMLAAAAQAVRDSDGRGLAPIQWIEADAVTWEPPAADYDAVISRFGVMFFSDPLAAFTNVARATRTPGRLAIAVWQHRDRSTLFSVPFEATLGVLRARGVQTLADGTKVDDLVAAGGQGPFSLHDPAEVTSLLNDAGWSDAVIETHALELPFGGGLSAADSATTALDFGPTRIALAGADEDVIRAAEDAIREAFAGYVDEQGHVVLSGHILVVTARREFI